ncbi:Aste57867_10956 [Aphanomyces stellatus]|uniref:Aste57867_10956 protein n=1 Tax=Aphanomyces stellatus TaxID=120398 RepID=A0A485KRN2_9STRA|nr:hypothetical protein As57867_010916 [Aphanomyces stellatus]VFT87824.1 Aste57867_10956 [Aphanomyces stellatus]
MSEKLPLFTVVSKSRKAKTSSRTKKALFVALGAIGALTATVGVVTFNQGMPAAPLVALATDPLVADPAFCDITRQQSGYIKISHKVDDHYFYWFFESRSNPETDPLVLWLTGGPGGSSMVALLSENGPCTIDANLTTIHNPYSWTNHANVIWLDQPTGVGFSYSTSERDDDHNEQDVGRNIYGFLQGFLKKNPKFKTNKFFITGESFGGHYVPAAAHYILLQNRKFFHLTDVPINLQGIAVGNGMTDTVVQVAHTVDMVHNAYNISLVDPAQIPILQIATPRVTELVKKCQAKKSNKACLDARDAWANDLIGPLLDSNRNQYDLREDCTQGCANHMQSAVTFLNTPAVQAKLHVKPNSTWQAVSYRVYDDFGADFMKDYVHFVPELLAGGVRVLIYAGDADLMCNWIGNEAWTKKMEWPHKTQFNAAPQLPLTVSGAKAGVVQSSNDLSFVRIFNAGHMVPMDQPEVSLALLSRFLSNQALDHP